MADEQRHPVDEARIREALERAEKATAGGWLAFGRRHFKPEHMSREGISLHAVVVQHPFGSWDAIFTKTAEDQEFIAHSREDVPDLANALLDLRSKARTLALAEFEMDRHVAGCQACCQMALCDEAVEIDHRREQVRDEVLKIVGGEPQ